MSPFWRFPDAITPKHIVGRTKPLARQWRLLLAVHFLIDGYSLCLGFLA